MLFVASCGSTLTEPSATGNCEPTPGQLVLEAMNQARAAQGLDPLTYDPRLAASAWGHSADMADGDFVGHTGSNGSTAGQRVEQAGYDWSYYAENVAAGQATAEQVVNAWMGSSGHRANILSPAAIHLGVGYTQRGNTTYGTYWTANFGSPLGERAPSPGACHP